MHEIVVPIAELPRMKIFLRVLIGKYPWRVNLYACIDHEDYTPPWEYWLSEGKKRKRHIEHPKLVNCFMTSDYVPKSVQDSAIDALNENSERAFVEGSDAAFKIMRLAEELLSGFQNNDDLIKGLLDVENYMFFGHYDRIITYANHLHLNNGIQLENALEESERKFGRSLQHRQFFFEYWAKFEKKGI